MAGLEFDCHISKPCVIIDITLKGGAGDYETVRQAIAELPGVEDAQWLDPDVRRLLVMFSAEKPHYHGDIRGRLMGQIRDMRESTPLQPTIIPLP